MGIQEYYDWFNEELNRLATQYHEAKRLGQKENTQESMDELYDFCFNHYQFLCKLRKDIKKMAEVEQNLGAKKVFEKLEQHLSSACEKHSKTLIQFAGDLLDLKINSP